MNEDGFGSKDNIGTVCACALLTEQCLHMLLLHVATGPPCMHMLKDMYKTRVQDTVDLKGLMLES